jgi:hypothetical protein
VRSKKINANRDEKELFMWPQGVDVRELKHDARAKKWVYMYGDHRRGVQSSQPISVFLVCYFSILAGISVFSV